MTVEEARLRRERHLERLQLASILKSSPRIRISIYYSGKSIIYIHFVTCLISFAPLAWYVLPQLHRALERALQNIHLIKKHNSRVREERVHGGRLDEHLGEEMSEEDDGGDVVKVRGPFVALARKMAESA